MHRRSCARPRRLQQAGEIVSAPDGTGVAELDALIRTYGMACIMLHEGMPPGPIPSAYDALIAAVRECVQRLSDADALITSADLYIARGSNMWWDARSRYLLRLAAIAQAEGAGERHG